MRTPRRALLVAALTLAALALPASASAASCTTGTTTWTGTAGDGVFGNEMNWSNGAPSANCDAVINLDGTYTITQDGAAHVKSLTLGTTSTSGTQTLLLVSTSANGSFIADNGITNGTRGAITLDCPATCHFSSPPSIDVQGSTLTNSGKITVASTSVSGGNTVQIAGDVTNQTSGVMQFNANALFTTSTSNSLLVNHGTLNIATGVVVSSSASSCGSAAASVTNDTGGQINATGTGTLVPTHYFQGAGKTSGTVPVTMSCGALDYTGTGASTVSVPGSVSMTGNIGAAQTLNVANTVFPTGAFTNAGTINLDLTAVGGSIDLGDAIMTNTGTISVAGSSGASIRARNLLNSGSLLVNSALDVKGSGSNSCSPGCVTNQGDVEIGSSTRLQVFDGYNQSAGTTNLNSATAKLETVGAPVTLTGGSFGGTGTVQANLINNGGTVSPGATGVPGTLAVNASYTQGSGGQLDARVSASANDLLSVAGTTTLAGTLAISTTGFTPTLGQTFTVLTNVSTRTGQFDTVTGADSGPYDVVYDPTDVHLVTAAGPPPTGPAISIDNPSLRNPAPGDGTLTFNVTLSQAPGGTGATVNYATSNGIARTPVDYASTSGTLSFGPAETHKTVTVTVHGAGAGPDRTLFLNLSGPTNAHFTHNRGTGTILNDRVSVASISPPTGGVCGSVTLTLHGAGFTGTPTVRLHGPVSSDIVATAVTPGPGAGDLTATFDLNRAAVGPRDVVVSLPSFGASATVPGGFKIQPISPPVLGARLTGPDAADPKVPWTGLLFITNFGNVDATDVTVRVDGFNTPVAVLGDSNVTSSASPGGVSLTIKRIHAFGNVGVRVRFSASGPGHFHYHLTSTITSRGTGCGGASGSGGGGGTEGEQPATLPPDIFDVEIRFPGDPNGKAGTRGYGARHYIRQDGPLPYQVMFENKPTASAPAHDIRIIDQLDARKIDLSTLSLGPVYFGNTLLNPPPNSQSWQTAVDLRPGRNLIVRVTANLDRQTGLLTWRLVGTDPVTGELVTEPARGFLPPDVPAPAGRGAVSFTARPVAGQRTGARITNGASIVFDQNAPILTPLFLNTVDSSVPFSHVASAAPATQCPRRGRACRTPLRTCTKLKVSWSGSDTGAGVASYNVYAARNHGHYHLWRAHTGRRSASYAPARTGSYAFYSVATDGVGHLENGHKPAELKAKLSCTHARCGLSTSSGAWDSLVRSSVQRGRRLTVFLSHSSLTRLHVTTLRLAVNGRVRIITRRGHLPARLILGNVPGGALVLTLRGATARGKTHGSVVGRHTSATC